MTTEATHSILKAAICAFKQEDISIKKETKNTFFKSSYADLATILDAIEKKAAKHGLVISSCSKLVNESWLLETVLEHKDSDEQKVSVFPIFGGKPQEIGSSITYARRYNIQSLLNLAADDDDGNAANTAPSIQTAKARKTSGTEILAAMNACESLEELEQVKKDYTQDINTFRVSANIVDRDFYSQIVSRGTELKQIFEQNGGLNG